MYRTVRRIIINKKMVENKSLTYISLLLHVVIPKKYSHHIFFLINYN